MNLERIFSTSYIPIYIITFFDLSCHCNIPPLHHQVFKPMQRPLSCTIRSSSKCKDLCLYCCAIGLSASYWIIENLSRYEDLLILLLLQESLGQRDVKSLRHQIVAEWSYHSCHQVYYPNVKCQHIILVKPISINANPYLVRVSRLISLNGRYTPPSLKQLSTSLIADELIIRQNI